MTTTVVIIGVSGTGKTTVMQVLADRLAAPGPVDVRGVAQAQLLLTDGTGPLYFPGATEELRARIANALSRLEVLDQR